MLYDERDPRTARQEFLEAVVGSFGGPACAPMPGTLIEMLEIAAMERLEQSRPEPVETPVDADLPLTSPRIGSRMIDGLRRAGEAIAGVADRLRTGSGARRLPV